MHDLIIIGGGPAGMTAAAYAARKKLDLLLISQDMGGQANKASDVANYMGYQLISGAELMQKFEEHLRRFSSNIYDGLEIKELQIIPEGFSVRDADGKILQTKSLIIATGKRNRTLNVPGEENFRGRGISYCSICDEPLFAEMNVAVIGSGKAALEAANDMIKIGQHVYIISMSDFTGDPVLINHVKNSPKTTWLYGYEAVQVSGDDFVKSITIRNLKTKETQEIAVSGILVEIGQVPNSDLVKNIVKLNQAGEIEIDSGNATNVPGLFAAGDVTNIPAKQMIVASGEGAKAALGAYNYLQKLAK